MRRLIPRAAVAWAKRRRTALRHYRDRLFSADLDALREALRALGVGPGDVMYARSSWDDMRSIRATPMEVIEALGAAVGPSGTIAMPTYPMTGLSQDYLDRHPAFDWRRTPSRAGMLTEIFRRMPGTERSLHPTHPLAARGPRAPWLTEGHETSEAPFDERSPFQRLLEVDALVLSLGRFEAMTLRHFADHQIRDRISIPLYTERQTEVRMTRRDGTVFSMLTRANNPALGCDHRVVLRRMIARSIVRTAKVGRVPLSIVRLKAYIGAYREYHEQGLFHHFLKPQPAPVGSGSPR